MEDPQFMTMANFHGIGAELLQFIQQQRKAAPPVLSILFGCRSRGLPKLLPILCSIFAGKPGTEWRIWAALSTDAAIPLLAAAIQGWDPLHASLHDADHR